MSTKLQLAGHYKLTAHKLDGSSRVLADWFENLITNQGLNRLGTGAAINHCQVGSGSAAPVITDTALQSMVAATADALTNQSGAASVAPYFGFYRRTFRFAAGVAAGNLSEVGVGWSLAADLFSRALIKDINGDPTTITVLSDEVLDVSYELRNYAPALDTTYSVDIGGVSYGVTGRAANANTTIWSPSYAFDVGVSGAALDLYRGTLGTVIENISSTYGAGSATTGGESYVNNSLQKDFNLVFSLDNGNAPGGFNAMSMYVPGFALFQFVLDDDVPKDNTKIMTLRARLSWGRYTG